MIGDTAVKSAPYLEVEEMRARTPAMAKLIEECLQPAVPERPAVSELVLRLREIGRAGAAS